MELSDFHLQTPRVCGSSDALQRFKRQVTRSRYWLPGGSPTPVGPTCSPFTRKILAAAPTGFPFRAGESVIVIFVPGAKAASVRFLPQPASTQISGAGPSAAQRVTFPLSSVTSKYSCVCGFVKWYSATTPVIVTGCLVSYETKVP